VFTVSAAQTPSDARIPGNPQAPDAQAPDAQAPSRRERKKLETRHALEEAALRLFGERGYEQTTVEDIAEAADVAVRTFFRYFSSKQDVLFGDVVTGRVQHLQAELVRRPPDEDPLESVRAVMDMLDFNGPDEEQQIMARMDLMRRQPSFVGRYLEIMDAMRTVVVAFVAERTGLDPSRDLFPLLVGGACTASWDASLKLWVASGATVSLPKLRNESFAALTAGLVTPTVDR
jgi:TetR/AcrR family transcriptional regulator, regulator of mycofactocin system